MTLKARITAIDRFVKGCREDGIYDDLNACCVMAGWDSLAGALTPLKGTAPTNSGFLDADLDRGIGLKGNGSSKYLDSNRAHNADLQNDRHISVFVANKSSNNSELAGSLFGSTGWTRLINAGQTSEDLFFFGLAAQYNVSASLSTSGKADFVGASRSDASSITVSLGAALQTTSQASQTPNAGNYQVFRAGGNEADNTLSWYSIGSATDLALLNARVSTLMADLRAIEEAGFDRDAIAYIRAVEAADGAYLETSVKIAINNLVSGLKAESLWDAIGSSCLLCGPRTLAGALVPLRGAAPTAYNFVSSDYNQETGLKDPDSQGYIRTNYSATNDPQSDHHISTYITEASALDRHTSGARYNGSPAPLLASGYVTYSYTLNTYVGLGSGVPVGFYGMSRPNLSQVDWIRASSAKTTSTLAALPFESAGNDHCVFRYMGQDNNPAGPASFDGRIAFYSFGRSLDVASLGSRISQYVADIAAAIP